MRYLIDSGILLRLFHRGDPNHLAVRQALRSISASGHVLCTTTQNVAEFWNVCTRPAMARGGFGLSVEEAEQYVRVVDRLFEVLREPATAYRNWRRIVVAQRVLGKQVHDARLAAAMKSYRIRRILTLNSADFSRFTGIEVFTPQDF